VRPGDDLAALIAPELRDGDIVVIAQKVVSKAEGRVVALDSVVPGAEAMRLANDFDKDARLVQVVLDESASVIRAERGVLICETRHGFVCANAGVDLSNAPDADVAVLLPLDPDASARRIRAALATATRGGAAAAGGGSSAASGAAAAGGGSSVTRSTLPPDSGGDVYGVIISDSFGRAWRLGLADVAIGAAGVRVLDDWRGRPDAHGRELRVTEVAVADQLAAAADLARAKDSQQPIVVIRGAAHYVTSEDGPGAAALRRPLELDLFR
jgi:coenzyme F420-0:L-glutamate ligase/coenzyme F420-1:gamma-L-glutamate ligase